MKRKILRLGWVLRTEGIINSEQLGQALDAQKSAPNKTLGEILTYLFGIPEYEIETVFSREIIRQTISDYFYSELEKKFSNLDKEIDELIPGINILIRRHERLSSFSSSFSLKSDMYQPTGNSSFLKKIICDIDHIKITTFSQKEVTFNDVKLEYDVHSKQIRLDNPAIMSEARLRLNQIFRSQ